VFVSVLYVSELRTLLGRVCVCQSCVDRCVYVDRCVNLLGRCGDP